MSINIQSKTNYSFLFNSMGSGGGSMGNLNFLSDYASIKNGSYGRLMKAYFRGDSGKEVSSVAKNAVEKKNNTAAADSTKQLAEVQKATDSLKASADALLVKGSKSVFKDDKITEDTYDTVSKFVSDYNSVVTATKDINNTSISGKAASMVHATDANKKLLGKVGITIGEDNSLSIDKDTFMKADFSTVKNLFNGTGSYGYRISAQSSLINYAADNAATKAKTYDFNGSYNNNYSAGNIFNSYF